MTDQELMHLYTNNTGRKSFQWELWPECNNFCTFCYLGETNRVGTKERHLASLRGLRAELDSLDFNVYNNISLIGGEFFQGQLKDPEIHELFMEIINRIVDLYVQQKIGSVWIAATLTIGDQKDLYDTIDIFEKKGAKPVEGFGASGLWICTSWDTIGRFHTQKHKDNWEYHMKHLKEVYPWIKFNTTIILQQKFLEDYLADKWSPKEFMKKWNTTLFYKQCGAGGVSNQVFSTLGDDYDEQYLNAKTYLNNQYGFQFFPSRETFLAFLRKYAIDDADTFDRLFNIKYRADELFRNYNEQIEPVKTTRCKTGMAIETSDETRINKCGHLYAYAAYLGNNKCVFCDRNQILESL